PDEGSLSELVAHIDGYLCEIKDIQVKDGLHVLGQPPTGDQLRGLVAAVLRLGSGEVPGLRVAIGAALGVDERALVEARERDGVDRLERKQTELLDAFAARGWQADAAAEVCRAVLGQPDSGVEAVLRLAAEEVVPRIRATTGELDSVLAALRGRHVPAGPSGSPTRGRLDVLPTGRNFYSVDPRALPSELSWEVGQQLADRLLERHRHDTGELPRMVGLVVWGTSAMRTQGDDVAEILALLGIRPTWHPETRRVNGLEVMPLSELDRPRIDVTVRISGFFRDAFPHLVRLLDDAVATVAGLDEGPEENYIAAHARADAERLAEELGAEPAWRRATARVFGSRPGTYGAGLIQLLDTRDWRAEAELAQVYEAWGGYAYGRSLNGEAAPEAMRDCFSRIDAAVKNVDNREHDILDSDDYYQYHGGMVATVRALTGREPAAYIGDGSDPSRVAARPLAEEARRVFRARVANPRWIASMIRHGYKGAAELSATVDYLFGYDATTGVVDDWMYEQVAQRYALDPDVAQFMSQSNPWAARAIAERLLEAADRGLWAQPSPDTLTGLRDRFLALEGELEEEPDDSPALRPWRARTASGGVGEA
ncbi:MAG TPA: cobaltochelatase subunit CobN, partial [Solirubrobacteraceae bacterium]|nr:cobaltochelatase subunit CobN [Solirubrobacteraceae bacterium]